jgi:type I restriction enzyme S subunit
MMDKLYTGVAIKNISKTNIQNIKIPIPPIQKQQEIVKYLDFIYEKANKTSQEKIVELKTLNEYCLNTQKIFGDNVVKTLGEICDILNGKRIVKNQVETGDYPVLGGGGITAFYTNKFTREDKTCKISREGMSPHNCVMLLNEKYYLNSQAFTINSKNEILIDEYLWYYLDQNKEQVYKCGRGTAQKAIDIEEFKAIQIPIPSLERQKEIVEYCDFNDNLIKQLEKEIENNKKQAKLFISSIVKQVPR